MNAVFLLICFPLSSGNSALLPGPVTNVSVDFVVYNNISQSVHFVLTWAPPSAPHGKILHFRISVEEVSSVADGSISTRTFIVRLPPV